MPRLENWTVADFDGGRVLRGDIYNDGRFEDGTYIITSQILNLDVRKMTARTLNSLYILGEEKRFYATRK